MSFLKRKKQKIIEFQSDLFEKNKNFQIILIIIIIMMDLHFIRIMMIIKIQMMFHY